MPLRHSPHTLRKCSMLTLAKHWDRLCYAAHSVREMNALLESEEYLNFKGPFTDMPSCILEDLMEVIRSKMSLNRKYLHLLILEQLQSLNLSLGIGEVYYGLHFLPRCKRLRELNLSYLRHVEPSQIMKLIPHLSSIVTLNLTMTSTIDPVLDMISFHCPNLVELNLTSCNITDQGLLSLCGVGSEENGVQRCRRLQRLLITETRATWIGALTILQHVPSLTDFDFDKIFQVFEHLDPKSVINSETHALLKIRSLYSTTPRVRGDSIDAAAALCPNIEILSVMNAWMDNDTFYKFMQFERLKSLTIVNSEGMTIDFDEGVLPILQVIGMNLENLILNKFESVDIVSLGRSCPKLRKIALSAIKSYSSNTHPVEGLFKMLSILELWSDEKTETSVENALYVLMHSAVWIERLLIKNTEDFSTSLLRRICQTNSLKKLERLILVECDNVDHEMIQYFLTRENNLSVLRIWSCEKIQREQYDTTKDIIQKQNLDVYFEWFP